MPEDTPMRSRLFPCTVAHRRFTPTRHAFAHRVFMIAVDLDKWDLLSDRLRLLKTDRRALYSLHDRDFLPTGEPVSRARHEPPPSAPGLNLKQRVLARIAAHGVTIPHEARVTLVSMPRAAGYLFNPVSFYFLSDAQGNPVAALAEVTNTFREVKVFALGTECLTRDASGEPVFRLRTPKDFYVSPFSPPDGEFEFVLHPPGKSLRLRVDHWEGGVRTLTAPVNGQGKKLSDAGLLRESFICPLVTLKTIMLIHLHALALWLKRTPWWPKSQDLDRQTDLRRPHEG